jgi:DNA-binding CsgD family transcriptional regulator
MTLGRAVESAVIDIRRLSGDGLDSRLLRKRFLARLERLIPFETAWFAMCDPATLLFTDAVRQEMPHSSTPRFVEDEFLLDDFNKWTELSKAPVHTQSLLAATGGDLQASYRWREILEPLGLGDELRAALVAGGACWGFICLHRGSGSSSFTSEEARLLDSLAAVMGDGLRGSLLIDAVSSSVEEAGVVVLAADLSVSSMSPRAERWLAEISDEDWPSMRELPPVVLAVAGRLRSSPAGLGPLESPSARLRTRAGTWLMVRASRLDGEAGTQQTAIVMAPAAPIDVAPMIMEAYGLTQRERELTGLVLRGMSTKQLGLALRISDLTVQQHLKSIFDKTGVRSRRELAAHIFAAHYQPKLAEGVRVGPGGYFIS